ncbi:hypothetical protein V1478_007188, partial [Vespula squamosa]
MGKRIHPSRGKTFGLTWTAGGVLASGELDVRRTTNDRPETTTLRVETEARCASRLDLTLRLPSGFIDFDVVVDDDDEDDDGDDDDIDEDEKDDRRDSQRGIAIFSHEYPEDDASARQPTGIPTSRRETFRDANPDKEGFRSPLKVERTGPSRSLRTAGCCGGNFRLSQTRSKVVATLDLASPNEACNAIKGNLITRCYPNAPNANIRDVSTYKGSASSPHQQSATSIRLT